MLFTDTDSVTYDIQTNDIYTEIANEINGRFDTSEHPKYYASGIRTSVDRKVIGTFKDEAAGKQIEEYFELRAKLLSYKMVNGDKHKKCKGVEKSMVKKTIIHEDYKETLFSRKEQYRNMNAICTTFTQIK